MEAVNKTWWHTYRQARNKPRNQLSLEIIWRKTVSDIWHDYLEHCSVAGIKQIQEKNTHIMQRFMWLLALSAAVGGTAFMLTDVWSNTMTKPLIVTMESSTHPIAEIDFPAVAICNVNRISMKNLKDFAEYIYSSRNLTYTLENITWYLRQGGRLLDYSYNENLRQRLIYFKERSHYKDDIIKVMEKLAPNCTEMLLRCSWHGTRVNCSDIFAVRRTALGHCCAFNYVLQYNSIGRPAQNKGVKAPVMRQKLSGWRHGLVVVLDPQLNDYAYPLRNTEGFDVLLFDPTHYADPSGGHVLQRIIQPRTGMLIDIQSVKQVATDEVRKYPISARKCRFRDELPDLYGDMYSYSACIASCKYKTIRSLCKCTPYYLPIATSGVRVCSLLDMQCLNKYKEKNIYMYPFNAEYPDAVQKELLDSLSCPECKPDCELTIHKLKTNEVRFVNGVVGDKSQVPPFVEGLNLSNLCVLYIYQGITDGVLNQLDVTSYWYEILSSVGGFAGMLMGFTIISIVEIIYYFVVRFVLVFIRNFKTYH